MAEGWRDPREGIGTTASALVRDPLFVVATTSLAALAIGAALRRSTRRLIEIRSASPAVDLHVEAKRINVPSPLGPLPGLVTPGKHDTWLILVPGPAPLRSDASFSRFLGLVPVARELGLPGVVASSRGDPEAPRSPDGLYHLGATEWRDLQATAEWAMAAGARRFVLCGFAAGAAAVGEFLGRSRYAGRVSAVVLDTPVLDWRAVLRYQAARQRLPPLVAPLVAPLVGELQGYLIARRIRANLPALGLLRHPDDLAVPTLLFHGVDDPMLPISSSRQLARNRADVVTFIPIAPGAGAARRSPSDYERIGRSFLELHALRRLPSARITTSTQTEDRL